MKDHFLEAPDDIKSENLRGQENRDNLSVLYGDSTTSNYAKKSTSKRKLSENERHIASIPNRLYLVIGTLIAVSILIVKIIYEFLTQVIHIDIRPSQPIVFFCFLILLGLFAVIYHKIINLLWYLGFRPLFFISYSLTCLTLITLPIYVICSMFKNLLISELAFLAIISIASVIISKILFIAIDSKKHKNAKIIVLIIIFAICLTAGTIQLISLLH